MANNKKVAYELDPNTIETLEDVKVILDKLNLTTYPEGDDWKVLKKYFTREVEVQKALVPQAAPSLEDLTAQLETKDYGSQPE